MDLGSGIPLAVAIFGASVAGWKAIPLLKKNGNGKCPLHGAIEARLTEGDRRMDQMCEDTAATREDMAVTRELVVAICAHLKVPTEAIKDELQAMLRRGK